MAKQAIRRTTTTPSFTEDLERQRDYVRALTESGFQYPLVAAQSFVRGMRDSGYKSTATAIDELVDNAIQAQATRVDIVMGYGKGSTKKVLREADSLAIVDNGHGMDGDVIRLAVLWGGTHRENDRSGFGRYGFGLPSASVSIGRRFTVISKVPGGEWQSVTVDLDEIAAGRVGESGVVQAPAAVRAELPSFVRDALPGRDLPHGTIVLLEKLDRLSSGFQQKFQTKMLEHLGVIYRGILREVEMSVVETGHPDGAVRVEPIDPLFVTQGARYYDDTAVMAEALPEKTFTVKDPETRDQVRGVVRVRYSYMPPNFQQGSKARFAVMKENLGLKVMRAGRQIDILSRLPANWHVTLVNYDRNYGVEIDFTPTLDEEFGVTVNKQQITPSDRMWDLLEQNGVRAAIADLRVRGAKEREEIKHQAKLAEEGGAKRASEEVAADAAKYRTRPKSGSSPKTDEERNSRLKEEAAKKARETGRSESDVAAEIDSTPYLVVFEDLPGAPFYRMLQIGGQRRLLINKGHRFFADVYQGARANKRVRDAIELLLIVLGECELDSSEDRLRFYEAERGEWSRRLQTALGLLDERDPREDAASASDAATEGAQ
jgi:hypothetical protein